MVDELERVLIVLLYDVAAARWHARELARLASLGQTPLFIDGQLQLAGGVPRRDRGDEAADGTFP